MSLHYVFERPPVAFGVHIMLFSLAAVVDLYQSGAYEALRAARSTQKQIVGRRHLADDTTEQESKTRDSSLDFCLQ